MSVLKAGQADAGQGFSDSKSSSVRLLGGCLLCIDQCQGLLAVLDAADYSRKTETNSSIGAHVRHVIERFQSFLSGLANNRIDYDARKRDSAMENNLESARFALNTIRRRLARLDDQICGEPMQVSETVHPGEAAVEATSTAEREIMSLISHSIHHLALVALLARRLGYELESDFGKAPSTVRFERS